MKVLLEPEFLATVEADVNLNEMVLRSLVLKIDPKLVDIMLQLAQDEHAVALQTVTEPPEELGEVEGEGPPRRGRRPAEVEG